MNFRPFLYVFLFFILQTTWAQNSVLSSGNWIKVGTKTAGVYKINKAFLDQNNIDTKNLNPQKIQFFMGQVGVLPQKNTDLRLQDLQELAIVCTDKDQVFDSNDQFFFYTPSSHSVSWNNNTFKTLLNPYSDSTYLYIRLDGDISKKVNNKAFQNTNDSLITHLTYYEHSENEFKNVLNSGRQWFGDFFRNTYDLNPTIIDKTANYPIKFLSTILPIGTLDQTLTVTINGQVVQKPVLKGSLYNASDNYARYNRFSNVATISQEVNSNNLSVNYALATLNSLNNGAYIDYIDLSYERDLRFLVNNQIHYYINNLDSTKNYLAQIKDSNNNTNIWHLSDNYNPENISTNNGQFNLNHHGILDKIIIWDNANVPLATFTRKILNQNIKNNATPNLLVVYPESFKTQLQVYLSYKLKYQSVLALSTQEIYNEFSGGKIDPTAIRDVCRYFWKKDSTQFKNLLLLGDASFDYKNNMKLSYDNPDLLVPTYESRESLEPIYSYNSDDYFGFLEDFEGEWPEGKSINNTWYSDNTSHYTLDIGVGRLPVKSNLELQNVIKKRISFDSQFGNWKNKIMFVADNRDYNLHQNEAENLSILANNNWPGFVESKLYLDDFVMVNTDGNVTAPTATAKLTNTVNDGVFLINYNGHGAENGWAQEKLLTLTDIENWQNKQLPIFFTATCQFGKFDNPNVLSGAELASVMAKGGAIGLFTTTRPVYSSTNSIINSAFFNAFTKSKTLGDLIKITKNQSISGEINRNFSLLGDPTVQLPNYVNTFTINTINDKSVKSAIIQALQPTIVKGKCSNIESGTVKVSFYGNKTQKKTLGSFDDSPAFSYTKTDNLLFEGNFDIVNTQFTASFNLPQKIDSGYGKMVFYAVSTDSTIQSIGYQDSLKISNIVTNPSLDKIPPLVTTTLLDGNLNFNISVYDSSGLNIASTNTLTKMQLFIDNLTVANPENYISFNNAYQKGNISLYVGNLADGNHTIKLIISDNYNNTTDTTFKIQLEKPAIKISRFINYPNPFSEFTNFSITHNKPGVDLVGTLSVFDVLGKELLNKEIICDKCPSNFDFGLDFDKTYRTGAFLIYKFVLQTASEHSSDSASGRLLFWK